MTCVLGMVVRREREIREFVETPFYRVLSAIGESGQTFEGEWRAVKGSRYFESFLFSDAGSSHAGGNPKELQPVRNDQSGYPPAQWR